jgi:hypothetical protein
MLYYTKYGMEEGHFFLKKTAQKKKKSPCNQRYKAKKKKKVIGVGLIVKKEKTLQVVQGNKYKPPLGALYCCAPNLLRHSCSK